MEKQFVNAKEAAAILSIGTSTLYRHVAAGVLPRPVKFGSKTTRWRVEELLAAGQASQPTTPSAPAVGQGIAHGYTQP